MGCVPCVEMYLGHQIGQHHTALNSHNLLQTIQGKFRHFLVILWRSMGRTEELAPPVSLPWMPPPLTPLSPTFTYCSRTGTKPHQILWHPLPCRAQIPAALQSPLLPPGLHCHKQ